LEQATRKPFDIRLKEDYGDEAEATVYRYLCGLLGADKVEQLPLGPYGPDLAFEDTHGRWVFADIERRGNWKAHQSHFPFDTVHMPKRKLRFTALGRPYFYISVRDDCQRAIVFHHEDIVDAVCVICGNRYVSAGEEFVDLPRDRGAYVELE